MQDSNNQDSNNNVYIHDADNQDIYDVAQNYFNETILYKRELARRNLYEFVKYKFEYYYSMPFLDNWHYGYLCEILHLLLQGQLHNVIISMPPSYGKTEIIARCFIPYSLGLFPNMKFIYASYGDELSRSVSVETRNFFKSKAYRGLFTNSKLIMDKSEQWFNDKGGGLFATTVGGAITGKHCHIGIADDLLKASESYSEANRKTSITYFTESFLSRLLAYENKPGRIIVIMQRLHKNDLAGYLKEVAKNSWEEINLEAINDKKKIYEIGNFSYVREANEALFPKRHTLEQLVLIKQTMGDYAFNAQYQQAPDNASGGFFDVSDFENHFISDFDIPKQKIYIFIDPAESTKDGSDNRAIVCVGISQNENELPLIVIHDCFFGKWNHEEFIEQSFIMMFDYSEAEVRIEPKGGGITLQSNLQKQLFSLNSQRQQERKPVLTNIIKTFKVPQNLSKHEKISTLLPAWNQNRLKIRKNARGISQIKEELRKYNPEKKANDDNCIDALSGITWQNDIYPYRKSYIKAQLKALEKLDFYYYSLPSRNVRWRV